MTMNKQKRFIVSCQAVEDEPMYGGPFVIERLVKSVLAGGASGIRISQRENIKPILKIVPHDIPLICITKKVFPNSEVYITPVLEDLKFLMDVGAKIIAIDATTRKRPKETLNEMVSWFHQHKTDQKLMADCSNIEDVKNAFELGFDLIGTTLRGYTTDTKGRSNTENNFAFIKEIIELNKKYHKQIIVEGGVNTPEMLKEAMALDIDGVVVGSAITRPKFITEMFLKALK
ncbi:MAG: putative N-acetylmannosamine-6-phosphate 2-epimerase [Candidatus Malacoplasma girerdii]|nr:MAG: putative N-acetylmannosamine-6-phosphate 2-epimerase [Candidatus Malacoplasma girerdii]